LEQSTTSTWRGWWTAQSSLCTSLHSSSKCLFVAYWLAS
jgi:hypothetical protein